ncbi:MAG: hypothetical protein WD013_02175 [Gemmatimonadota bacterium]
MRRICDLSGDDWDIVLGHASWGVFEILFVPVDGGRDTIRTAPLPEVSRSAADQALMRFQREDLLELLAASQPWSGSG